MGVDVNNKFAKLSLASVFLLSGFFQTAFADSAYVAVSLGKTSGSIDEQGIQAISGPNISSDTTASSFKVQLGMMPKRGLGFEVGYIDFGTLSAMETTLGIIDTYDFDVTGNTIAGIVSVPSGRHSTVYGKIGVVMWESEATVCLPWLGGCGASSTDGNDPFFGIGMEYRIAANMGLRAEFERYDVPVTDAGAGDFNNFSVSAAYRF
ncbi:hypothetical protein Tel_15495 [Candidatus Tenderia electrophaga]|uniref:Outer membrane protein OmpA-like transmembrane domain-containing protein n=1 Tax=Candidatus Tenderia electrophaga TaxID=1748243 RepID=A0A0S2TH23_9GAMM|nr:hypothetical protein Tel_15495 [Candidatus Tenderia electrophaga]